LRVILNLAAGAAGLLAASLAPSLAAAHGRASDPPASPFEVWRDASTAGRTAPALRLVAARGRARETSASPVALWRNAPTAGRAAPAPSSPGSGSDVVAEASRWIGSGKFTAPPGPWCADAVSAWLERTGHRPLDSRMASAALAYGPQLSGPQVGALAVLGTRRGWAAHVGVVSGVEADGSIRLISGNWGARVAEATVSRRSVVAFVAVQ
jgi:uncharacterized protein (TIGR02594 family)